MTTESQRLRGTLDLMLPALAGTSRRFLDHPRISDLYPEYLFFSHCIARASIPLMDTARDRALALADHERNAGAVASYLEGHMVEEKDHDEWFLEDLEVLGRDRSQVLARAPSPTVAGLVGAQYYWVLHYHPIALLGFLAALESHPPSRGVIDAMIARTGYSPKAFRTLIEHAELDPHHEEELNDLVDSLDLTPEQSNILGLSGMHALHMTALSIQEIVDRAGGQDRPGSSSTLPTASGKR